MVLAVATSTRWCLNMSRREKNTARAATQALYWIVKAHQPTEQMERCEIFTAEDTPFEVLISMFARGPPYIRSRVEALAFSTTLTYEDVPDNLLFDFAHAALVRDTSGAAHFASIAPVFLSVAFALARTTGGDARAAADLIRAATALDMAPLEPRNVYSAVVNARPGSTLLAALAMLEPRERGWFDLANAEAAVAAATERLLEVPQRVPKKRAPRKKLAAPQLTVAEAQEKLEAAAAAWERAVTFARLPCSKAEKAKRAAARDAFQVRERTVSFRGGEENNVGETSHTMCPPLRRS